MNRSRTGDSSCLCELPAVTELDSRPLNELSQVQKHHELDSRPTSRLSRLWNSLWSRRHSEAGTVDMPIISRTRDVGRIQADEPDSGPIVELDQPHVRHELGVSRGSSKQSKTSRDSWRWIARWVPLPQTDIGNGITQEMRERIATYSRSEIAADTTTADGKQKSSRTTRRNSFTGISRRSFV